MFRELKGVVDAVRTAVARMAKSEAQKVREEAVLGMLRFYYILKDCVDEGAKLIEDAGPDPAGKIAAMDPLSAKETLEEWDEILGRQARRLRALQGAIFGQYHLEVADPKLQDEISELIGSKVERANSLHAIGAGLFFKEIFGLEVSDNERAKYVLLMAGVEGDTMDMVMARREVEELQSSLDAYRNSVTRFVKDEELLVLSRQARLDTNWKVDRR